jgi:uncharacterized membrane protein
MKSSKQKSRRLEGWGIPLAYVTVTLAVGMIFPRIEHRFFPDWVSTMSAASAMGICSAIASGMLALTGIVFSLAFVMVQFSATAYSPRLVLWVANDKVVSHALGVFTSTFLYALSMLAWVDRKGSGAVPFISGWLVFVLLVASVGMFVALIERLGMLQVNRMLIFAGDQGRQSINELYPSATPRGGSAKPASLDGLKLTQTVTHQGRPQVIQTIRTAELVELARQHDAIIEVVTAVGDTILETSALLRVYSARQPLNEAALKDCFEIGEERTFEQDPKYALRLLVDIAIKALSPAINDPTTAVQALDQIEDLLIRLGRRQLDIGDYRDQRETLRLVVPFPAWEDFLRLALDEIRFCGANSVQVMRRMNALVKNLLEVLPAERHPSLHHWEERLQGTVERSFKDADEKQDASVADRQGLGIGEEKPDETRPPNELPDRGASR